MQSSVDETSYIHIMTDEFGFRKLIVRGWRQFESIDLDIDPRLTVITGANGCGKTTLIGLFGRHFGFHRPYLATPKIDKSGEISYFSGYVKTLLNLFQKVPTNEFVANQIGRLDYSQDRSTQIVLPASAGVQYNIEFPSQQHVPGIMIGSHRPFAAYQPVANIPVNAMTPQAAYSSYFQETFNRYNGSHSGYSPVYRMKEALLSMAAFGPGNERIQRNQKSYDALNGFEEVLKTTLPSSLGFRKIIIRQSDVLLDTESGEFIVDAASGGIMALVDICWQIHLYSLDNPRFVVVLDEPENHLHPTMQRSLMSNLMAAFPNVQFIAATHSPFVVSSVKDSKVYALRYYIDESRSPQERRRVVSEELNLVDKAGTANEILREVLGVPMTAPQWVEDALSATVYRYSQSDISRETLGMMKADLVKAGLGEYYAEALVGISKAND